MLVESFADVFGSKATRKRVTLKNFSTLDDLADSAQQSIGVFNDKRATHLDGESGDLEAASEPVSDEEPVSLQTREAVFSKGQSRRIWNELYRYDVSRLMVELQDLTNNASHSTIDSSDVIIHVLDARDPLGTTCRSIQDYLRKEAPHVSSFPTLLHSQRGLLGLGHGGHLRGITDPMNLQKHLIFVLNKVSTTLHTRFS